MRDDDEDEDERVAALQGVLAPLRESPRAWGDVVAHARFATTARARDGSVTRSAAVIAAVAAALVVGWIGGRASAPEPIVVEVAEVTAPWDPPCADVPAQVSPPMIVHVPVPMIDPTIPSPSTRSHDDLVRLLQNIERNKTLKALVKLRDEEPKQPASRAAREPNAELDVDCILDPTLSKCMKGTDSDLPDTLTTTEVKQGVQPVKAQARACGPTHEAAAGETVAIKLSVAGATGRVTSAVAQSPHRGTALGQCVADALANARFRRFRNASLGIVYPVSM